MLLYIVRHAWAEDPDNQRWPNDELRPLTDKGAKRFRQFVRALARQGFSPQLVVTSPLLRCHQTAEVIAEEVPSRPPVVSRPELAPGSDASGLVAWTAERSKGLDQIAWVGHAPDVGQLAARLIGEPCAAIHFSKGAVGAIEFDGGPREGRGELQWLVTAKLLGV